jgi:hypothetical protein
MFGDPFNTVGGCKYCARISYCHKDAVTIGYPVKIIPLREWVPPMPVIERICPEDVRMRYWPNANQQEIEEALSDIHLHVQTLELSIRNKEILSTLIFGL